MNPILYLDYAGIAVFAATGALAASRKQLDVIGFLFLASATGIGGGTFRDLILGAPVFWVKNPAYVLVCVAIAILVYFSAHRVESRWKLLLWLDAIGLSAYAVMGAAKGLAATGSPTVAVVTGMLTATFGGILRDLLAGEPSVLLRPEIYVTAAMAGAARLHALRSGRRRDAGFGDLPDSWLPSACAAARSATAGAFRPTRAGPDGGRRTFVTQSAATAARPSAPLRANSARARADLLDDDAGGERAQPAAIAQAACRWCSRTGSPPRKDRRPRSCRPVFRARSPATTSVSVAETITEPFSERVTAASLQSLRISSSAVSNDAVW